MTCTYCPRCIDAGALGTLAELVPLVDPEHLGELRHRLRDDARWSNLTPAQRLIRADLLDAVSRRLVAERGTDPVVLEAAGDLYPAAPSDLSGLVGGES